MSATSSSPSRSRERVARILEAADHLFTSRSYTGVSMRDIAEAADVPKAVVFYHFGKKADLFERVMRHYYEAHREALQSAFAKSGTLAERVHGVIDAYLDFMEENRRFPLLVQRELASPEQAPEGIRSGVEAMVNWFEKSFEGVFPEEGPMAARHFFVTFAGIFLNYYVYAPVAWAGSGIDPLGVAQHRERRQHVHWLVDTILAGLSKP